MGYFCRTLRNFFGGSKSLDGNRVSGIYELFLRRASESGSPGICVPHHTCPCQCVLHFSPCVIEPTLRLWYLGFEFLVWYSWCENRYTCLYAKNIVLLPVCMFTCSHLHVYCIKKISTHLSSNTMHCTMLLLIVQCTNRNSYAI